MRILNGKHSGKSVVEIKSYGQRDLYIIIGHTTDFFNNRENDLLVGKHGNKRRFFYIEDMNVTWRFHLKSKICKCGYENTPESEENCLMCGEKIIGI